MSPVSRGVEKRLQRPPSKAVHTRVDRRTWDSIKDNQTALIDVYFHQSLRGCGWADCSNKYCRTSGSDLVQRDNTELAAMAIRSLGNSDPICLDSVNVRRAVRYRVLSEERERRQSVVTKRLKHARSCHTALVDYISELVPDCTILDSLKQTFDAVLSFDCVIEADEKVGGSSNSNLLSYLRRVFIDPDAMEYLFVNVDKPEPSFDWQSVPTLIKKLHDKVGVQLMSQIDVLCKDLEARLLSVGADATAADNFACERYFCFLFLFELTLEQQLPTESHVLICEMCHKLPDRMRHELVQTWATRPSTWLRAQVTTLQQSMAVRALHKGYDEDSGAEAINEDKHVVAMVHALRLLYLSALLGGETDKLLTDDQVVNRDAFDLDHIFSPDWETSLDHWAVRAPRLPYDEFTSDTLSECLDPTSDYRHYVNLQNDHRHANPDYMPFLPDNAFVVSTEQRMNFLLIDNKFKMNRSIRPDDLLRFLMGSQFMPFLHLHVRRTHAVQDALVWLGSISADTPDDLRKQLRVKFDNEDGVDEGGLSKEFYQIIVEDLFNPDYGMFEYNESTRTYWFSRDCKSSLEEFKLIGLLFGLAIYNSIQVAARFPIVLYRKLLSRPGRFADLIDFDPVLHSSLSQMLECAPDEVQDTYGCTFTASYTNVFGELVVVPLCNDGANMPVTGENRAGYCELYADWLLNKSVERMYDVFYEGFTSVCDTALLASLFGPEQVEQVVCGQEDFDWDVVKPKTYYSQGYSASSPTIGFFWDVVSEMDREDKRLLLQFCTGCDRAPLGGLAKMPFAVMRCGDHSDRLPTAQTCYNLLLLPEYNNKDWLRERLLKAIREGRGFGLV